MRRLLALSILVAARQACCCAPAPANALCAPDRCDRAAPLRAADRTTQLRGFPLPPPLALSALPRPSGTPASAPPTPGALVGQHERAAPRLPLRI